MQWGWLLFLLILAGFRRGSNREIFLEEWRGNLESAREIGASRGRVAWWALRAAVATSFGTSTRRVVVACILIAVGIVQSPIWLLLFLPIFLRRRH